MVRRTSRTRDGFSSWLVAAWKRRLNCSRFSSPSCSESWSSVFFERSSNLAILNFLADRFTEAGDHLRLDRQFLSRALEGDAGERAGNSVQLEQDPARLHARGPEFGRALALALTNLGG